jgi:hypothetical protein
MATSTYFHHLDSARVRVVENEPDDDSRFWSLELRDKDGNSVIIVINTVEQAYLLREVMPELPAYVDHMDDY